MFTAQEQQEIKLFLALLFPWDDDHKDLWKSVSWTFTKREGGMGFASYAAQSMDDLCRLISTRANYPAANVYVALGTQRMALQERRSVDNFPAASRTIKNIVSLKSLYMDIDISHTAGYGNTLVWTEAQHPGLGEQLVHVQTDLDLEKFNKLLIDLLSRPPAGNPAK